MRRSIGLAVILMLFVSTLLTPVVQVRAEITSSDVQASVERGIQWLISRQNPDGSWPAEFIPTGKTIRFCSYFAMLALRSTRSDARYPLAVSKGLDYLRGELKSAIKTNDWGWCNWLSRVFILYGASPSDPQIQSAINIVLQRQNPDGSFGAEPTSTPEVMWTLALIGYSLTSDVMTRALDYVYSIQNPDGSWAWAYTGGGDSGITGMVVRMLLSSGVPASDTRIQKAITYIKSRQDSSGGWQASDGYWYTGTTCECLNALTLAGEPLSSSYMQNGLRFLLDLQNPDGSFVDYPGATGYNWIGTTGCALSWLGIVLHGHIVPLVAETKILPVPYCHQSHTMWCGPASLAMVLRYYGYHVHAWEVAAGMHSRRWWGTTVGELKNYVEIAYPNLSTKVGFYEKPIDRIFYDIQGWILNGYPVILHIFRVGLVRHFIVVVGYNSTGLFVHDPGGGVLHEWGLVESGKYIATYVKWEEIKQHVVATSTPGFTNEESFLVVQGNPKPLEGGVYITFRTESVYSDFPPVYSNVVASPTGFVDPENSVYVVYDGLASSGLRWAESGRLMPQLEKGDRLTVMAYVANHHSVSMSYKLLIVITGTTVGVISRRLFELNNMQPYSEEVRGYVESLELKDSQQILIQIFLMDVSSRIDGWINVIDSILVPEIAYQSRSSVEIKTPVGTIETLKLYSSSTISRCESDEVEKKVSVIVSGTAGTYGSLRASIPRSLLSAFGSSITRLLVLIDRRRYSFNVTEEENAYVLTIGYVHSERVIEIYYVTYRLRVKTISSGQPLINTDVCLIRYDGSVFDSKYSDDNGYVIFEKVPQGNYTVEVRTPVPISEGVRASFTHWNDGMTSNTRTVMMQNDSFLTANYKTQYYLAIDAKGGVVNMQSQWFDSGTTVVLTATSPCNEVVNQSRLIFVGWNGSLRSTSLSMTVQMDGPKTMNANWKTQFYLRIVSPYGSPNGEAWYDEGSTATFSVTSPIGMLVQQVFVSWSGDSTATTPTATIIMDRPRTVTANWRTDYTQLWITILLMALFGIVAIASVRKRRKAAVVKER